VNKAADEREMRGEDGRWAIVRASESGQVGDGNI
jgi:hypothetical protein